MVIRYSTNIRLLLRVGCQTVELFRLVVVCGTQSKYTPVAYDLLSKIQNYD